jgi:triosephosphate isomerase
MRTPLVAGNWKMFKTVSEAVAFAKEFRPLVEHRKGVEIVLAPPFTAVRALADALRGSNVGVAAQNLHWESQGAFTGEVAAPMIKEAGAGYVIIGHSERRQFFGESDQTVNRKIVAALDADLLPIVCIGETLGERESNQTFTVIDRQIASGLAGLSAQQFARLVIAYEPVWAIGTGRNATAAQAQEVHAHVRRRLDEQFGRPAADSCRILYGGSVKPDNIGELAGQPDVDGALVGGASLNAASFGAIVAAAATAAV